MNKNLLNKKLLMDGVDLFRAIGCEEIDSCFIDPQYRGIMDAMNYGNEGSRQSARVELKQMPEELIIHFLKEIARVLKPSAYCFLWADKFIVAEGSHLGWFKQVNDGFRKTQMFLVDKIIWDKGSFGNGYRARRTNEELLVYQRAPKTTKNWLRSPSVKDTWTEKIPNPRSKELHPHRKPIGLTTRLIEVTTQPHDIILDPCAGSFLTMDACKLTNRNFIGGDIDKRYACEKP